MARPLSVSFVSDVTGFLKGTNDIEGALDEVADSLDDVSREAADSGERAGREFADGIEDGMRDIDRDAQRLGQDAGESFEDGLTRGEPGRELRDSVEDDAEAMRRSVEDEAERMRRSLDSEADRAAADVESATERMESSFRGTFDDVPRNAKSNLTQMSQSVDDGASRSKASMEEIKQEGLQNASETFSSFDGSARSFAEGIQGTFGGVVSALGPLGAAVGAAGAIGIGAITSALDKSKEKAEELRQTVNDLVGSFIDAGDATVSLEDAEERLQSLAEIGEENNSALEEMAAKARAAGIDFEGYAQAIASLDTEALQNYKTQFVEAMDEQGLAGQIFLEGEIERIDEAIKSRNQAAENYELAKEAEIESSEAAAAAQEAADERRVASAERAHESFTENAERLRETNQGMADAITDAYDQVATDIAEAADDGELSIEELEEAMREAAERQAASTERWAWAAENLSQNQINALLDMGEQGEQALETIMNNPPEATADTLGYLEQQGRRKGQAERRGVVDAAGDPVIVTVRPQIDERAFATARDRLSDSVHVRLIPGVDQAV